MLVAMLDDQRQQPVSNIHWIRAYCPNEQQLTTWSFVAPPSGIAAARTRAAVAEVSGTAFAATNVITEWNKYVHCHVSNRIFRFLVIDLLFHFLLV